MGGSFADSYSLLMRFLSVCFLILNIKMLPSFI